MRKKKSLIDQVPNEDTSPQVHQRSKIKFDLNIRQRKDLTQKQIDILKVMLDKDTKCVFLDGYYGCSKSFLSILAGLQLINNSKCDGLIYIRNPIESSTTGRLGYMPGGIDEKMAPYASPLNDKLDELLPKSSVDYLQKEGRIEVLPLGFARGRSWNCKAIVIDEASSLTWDDLILILTRCGEFCRIFIVGDSENQSDIGSKSGFRKVFDLFSNEESRANGVFTFELKDKDDIVRSKFVKFVLEKFGLIKSNVKQNENKL